MVLKLYKSGALVQVISGALSSLTQNIWDGGVVFCIFSKCPQITKMLCHGCVWQEQVVAPLPGYLLLGTFLRLAESQSQHLVNGTNHGDGESVSQDETWVRRPRAWVPAGGREPWRHDFLFLSQALMGNEGIVVEATRWQWLRNWQGASRPLLHTSSIWSPQGTPSMTH